MLSASKGAENLLLMSTRFEQEENQTSAHAGHQAAVDFEELLSDLSAAFVRVSVDQIDNEIERWLERIVLAMGIDRSTVIQIDPRDRAIYTTHQLAREGVSLDPDVAERFAREPPGRSRKLKIPRESFPWLSRKVLSGETVIVSRLEDLPPEASKDREDFRQVGNKSNVTIPVRVGGVVVGALMFGAILFEKHWSAQEVQRLKLLVEIFGNALERKRAEAEIHRISEELRQTAQVVTMGELNRFSGTRTQPAARSNLEQCEGCSAPTYREDTRSRRN
jgi:GAF domain-containing protein